MTGRRRFRLKNKAQAAVEYCPGFVDEHGQWNNGFYCPKWSKVPNRRYCCGDQYERYCCKPEDFENDGSPPRVTLQPHNGGRGTNSHRDYDRGGIGFDTNRPGQRVVSAGDTRTSLTDQTSGGSTDSNAPNIPLIAGACAGGLVGIVIVVLILCCICPCCPLSRKKPRRDSTKHPLPADLPSPEKEPTRDGTISDTDTASTALVYPISLTSTTSQSSIPSAHAHESLVRSPLMIPGQTRLTPTLYKSINVGTVPPYVREDPPPYPDEVMEALKPNYLAHMIPELYPHEEIDAFTLTSPFPSGLTTADIHMIQHSGNLTALGQSRLLKHHHNSLQHHSPHNYRNLQIHQNKYAM